jgi:hypothetical protein
MAKQALDLLAGGTTVSLTGFSDQAKTLEHHPGQVYGFDFHIHAVGRGGVHEHELEIPKVGAESYRAGPFLRPFFARIGSSIPGTGP